MKAVLHFIGWIDRKRRDEQNCRIIFSQIANICSLPDGHYIKITVNLRIELLFAGMCIDVPRLLLTFSLSYCFLPSPSYLLSLPPLLHHSIFVSRGPSVSNFFGHDPLPVPARL